MMKFEIGSSIPSQTTCNGAVSRRQFLASSCLLAGAATGLSLPVNCRAAELSSSAPLKLRPGVPQNFFDDSLISYQRQLIRRWLPAVVHSKPLLVSDRPWEGEIQLHGSIQTLPEGGYRMYYASQGGVLVAESADGLAWHKPELDIVPWKGKPTNMILEGVSPQRNWSIASINVIHDEQDEEFPFKMTSFQKPEDGKEGALFVYKSRDGLRFEAIPGPRFEMGDRNTMMGSRVNGKFVGYVRKVGMFSKYTGVRSMFYVESPDFLNWSEPQLALAPDLQDEPDLEFYGMSVFQRHDWFVGLVECWRADTDSHHIQLAFSRDLRNWHRPEPRTPFMVPTNGRWPNHCAANSPLYLTEQMAFYFGGSSNAHHYTTTDMEESVIGLATLELDRFCALEGTTSIGWIDTVPLVWPGGNLVVNADTRESYDSHPTRVNGELVVEVLDESGTPIPKWSGRKDRAVFQGNTHCRKRIYDGTVRWDDRGLDHFTGKTIRLRFAMKHARLFTFQSSIA